MSTKKFMLLLICLMSLMACSNAGRQQENAKQDDDSTVLETPKPKATEPEWLLFETLRDNQDGYIHTRIKTDDDIFIVWVSYRWQDTTKIPNGEKNIKKSVDCYGFNSNFTKIGFISHYDYLENGNAINIIENNKPEWSYIMPDSEGEQIANAADDILEEAYRFNKDANRIYRHRRLHRHEDYSE